MTPQEILKYRLTQQQIALAGQARTKFKKPEEVVHWLGAVQAQDYPGGLWGVGLRTQNATRADIEQAITDRKIVRTWPMRGTLHFIAADDIRWMLKLSTPRIISGSTGRWKQLGLDDATFAKARKVITKALQSNKTLTRKEMYEVWDRGGVSTATQRGLHLLWRMAQEGLTCFAPHQGKQAAFTLLDEWIPRSKELTHEESLAEMALRYFTSHGPATIKDFTWWSGLKVSDAKIGIELVKSKLISETYVDETYWMSSNIPNIHIDSPDAHLLPPFDEYLVSYKNRSAAVEIPHASKIFGNGNGIFSPVIVIDGKVVGTWARTTKKDHIIIALHPFEKLNKAQLLAIESAAHDYGKFMDLSVKLVHT